MQTRITQWKDGLDLAEVSKFVILFGIHAFHTLMGISANDEKG